MPQAKKLLFLLCLSIGLALFAVALWPMQTLTFSAIPVLREEEIDALIEDRIALPFDILTVNACREALPHDDASDTWYTPALTEDVTVDIPRPWRIARTSRDGGGTSRIVLYGGTLYTECTLIETGLPLIDVQLKRFDLDPQYIENWRTSASARILSRSESGALQWQTDRIDIKTRGKSSLTYPKKSYTLFFLDTSGKDGLSSPLGLPADRKFALNSLYEDDSKIRDALSYRLWEAVDPDTALQLEYTELLINNEYFGLYGLHGLPTENTLPYAAGDAIYKINTRINVDASDYHGDLLPEYEVCAGDPLLSLPFAGFMQQFACEVDTFPVSLDRQNFVDNAVFREIIASEDTYLQNLIVSYSADKGSYRLIPWDLDQSFGNVLDGSSATYVDKHFSQTQMRHLHTPDGTLRLLPVLYGSHPDFAAEVAARYRELRQTVFTDAQMLEEAATLHDLVTDSGARARDAARWQEGPVSEDNGFIEAFIPARMAFLDQEFAAD